MQIVSNKYKEYLNNSLSISSKSKIVVDDIEYLGDVIKTSPKFSHSNSTFIGGFPAKTVSFDIYNLNNDLDFINKEIKVYKGITIDGIVEWVMQGIFLAQSKDITNNISTKTMSISKAQDKTQLFDSKYESVLNWENGQTHTGLEIVQEVCTKLGITLETNDFSWANYNFKQPNFVEDITYREVISRIAQIGGEIAFINNSGSLVIKNQIVTGDKIQRKRYKNLSKEKLHTVNTVVLGKKGMNDDIKYPETIVTDRVEFKINDNPFVDLYRKEMISTVAEYIIGKSYTPFTLEDFVDGFIYELNDVVTIIDKNGDEFDAVILDCSNSSRIKSNIKAETPDKNNTDYKLAGSFKEEIRKVKLDVDHVNQKIEAVASDVSESSEKINQLEMTSESTVSRISNVETGLNTTNSNLSTLTGTVDTLNKDIQGVSADFEDFKDNEYVQGIDNLQKQIDGAIQFWNGAEIPTVSNYPANEWTTENDKINHQADIYTVVQDVEGEMKQGKSYRFDKVGGVWQWIELTDNELSAVQAIAQEALNKANTNANEIGGLKSSVSTLEQTDKSIKASVETINNQIIPTSQISGSYIHIEDSADAPLINLEIEGKSEQKTRSGKNLLPFEIGYTETKNGVTLEVLENGIKLKGAPTITSGYIPFNYYVSLPAGPYTVFFPENRDGLGVQNPSSNLNFGIADSNKIRSATLSGNIEGYGSINVRYDVGELNEIITPMLLSGTYNEQQLYEAYGVSPSPSYPSEIKSVGYKNLLYIDKGISSQGITTILNEDGGLSVSGTSTSNYANLTDILACNFGSGDFIYSIDNLLDINIILRFYDSDKATMSSHYVGPSKISTPIVLTGKEAYYRLLISTTTANTYDFGFYPQLEKGTVAHPYIPCGKYGIVVKTIGKQLFDKSKYTSGARLGSDGANYYEGATDYFISEYIHIQANETYTVNFSPYSMKRICYYDSAKHFINANTSDSTFTTPENAEYLRFSNLLAEIDSIQLEKGAVSTIKEEYKSSSQLIILNERLKNIGNSKDVVYIKNNKLYIDRKVGSIVLDGTETWVYDTSHFYFRCPGYDFGGKIPLGSSDSLVCSSHFEYIAGWANFRDSHDKNGINNISDSGYKICLRNLNCTTVAEFKEWLSANNVEIQYELAEPYTEEIVEIEMPSTFKGVTNITTTDELEPIINLEYVRDTNLSSYVEGQIQNERVIREENIAQLIIEDNQIKESVQTVSGSVDGLNTTVNSATETLTSQGRLLEIVSTNIDKSTGEVREVTTTTGFTFNAKGMTISDDGGFKGEHTAQGTFYKDGETVTGQYTKDGSKQKDLELFGTYSYGKENIDDTPMFIAQLYKDENGEECFGHFYNGGGY